MKNDEQQLTMIRRPKGQDNLKNLYADMWFSCDMTTLSTQHIFCLPMFHRDAFS